jgi:hypothetical protein
MEWEIKNGVLVPKMPLEPIHIFVDETFAHARSGFFQAAFPVPANIYGSAIVPQARKLLKQLGDEAIEFKGSAIKPGNVRFYRDFLHLFINISAFIADHSPLYPIVSIDGMGAYGGQQFECVKWNVVGALNTLSITDSDKIAAEFSRQMLWLHWHLSTIAPKGFRNEVIFTFDDKYRHAAQTQAKRFFSGEQLIAPVLSKLETVFTTCANALFSEAKSEMKRNDIGRVRRFRFVRSEQEFGLQAADLLSHLIYSAVRGALGIADTNTECKVALLREVMPNFEVDAELKGRLSVVAGNDGRRDVHLADGLLRSRIRLEPS